MITNDDLQVVRDYHTKSVDFLNDQLSAAGLITDLDLAQQILVRVLAFSFRQLEAISAVSSLPAHGAQVAQLTRGMTESWFVAAWLFAPDTPNERCARAVGFEQSALRQARDKLEYQHGDTIPAAIEEALERRVAAANALEAQWGKVNLPKVKHGMERLGQRKRYSIYRWDSDAVHVSSLALSGLTTETEFVIEVRDDAPPESLLPRLGAAWGAFCDLIDIAVEHLPVDMDGWSELRDSGSKVYLELFARLKTEG